MKVFAVTIKGLYLAWSDVDSWMVSGPMLTMWRGKTPEAIRLPREVIGLYDDTPPVPVPPGKYEVPKKREDPADGLDQIERDAPQRRYGRQRARHA